MARNQIDVAPTAPIAGNRSWWVIGLAAIVVFGTVPRLAALDRTSLWYDEVVTMRLARSDNPVALCRLLSTIDATRAPLHPLLLQQWVKAFGPSDFAGRSFSVLCGVATIALVFAVGTLAFDRPTGLWAAWLCSLSPVLVYYSREVRMYSWLVMTTCAAWALLFGFARSRSRIPSLLYLATLIALVYSHPLGLLMVGALGLASLLNLKAFHLTLKSWLVEQAVVLVGIGPWLRNYLDHDPESTTGPLSIRFLLGVPIGFVGGNFAVLAGCIALILFGFLRSRGQVLGASANAFPSSIAFQTLLIWLVIPPATLYLYSRISHPVFGPARYTLFVGPAYLVLLARGMTFLPRWPRFALAAILAFLSTLTLRDTVYPPALKADWRSASRYLEDHDPSATVIVVSANPSHNAEVETARYYLGVGHQVVPMPTRPDGLNAFHPPFWVAVGLRDGRPAGLDAQRLPWKKSAATFDVPGLRLFRLDSQAEVSQDQEPWQPALGGQPGR